MPRKASLKPGRVSLLVGRNGSGKTTLLEGMRRCRWPAVFCFASSMDAYSSSPKSTSPEESRSKVLFQNGSNLPSWLRTVSQENPRAFAHLMESLTNSVTGFEQLRFRDIGDGKQLEVLIAGEKQGSRERLGHQRVPDVCAQEGSSSPARARGSGGRRGW